MKTKVRLVLLAMMVGVVGLPLHAATITVAPGVVTLTPGDAICSLREAILNVEKDADLSGGDCPAGSGVDTIVLGASSVYSLTDRDPYPLEPLLNDREPNGLPEIRSEFTITGNGATIQRDPFAACFRVLYVSVPGNLSLNNVTLQNGCANLTDAAGEHGAGGAIFNRGTLTLDTVTITNNFAFRSGGGIHNDGTLTVRRSTVRNNSVTGGGFPNYSGAGGGIVNRGAMQVFQSTIHNNTTGGAGGGVDVGVVAAGGAGDGAGNASIANTTVSGNISQGSGGGMFFGAAPARNSQPTVVNSTVASNFSDGLGGGGIWVNYGSTVTLTNSIVAQPLKGTNCWFLNFGNMIGGNNLDTDGTCAGSTTVADPMLGPLANNGGPTQTRALLIGSPAIGAANTAAATAPPVNAVDQRGVFRPQGATADIGAFELEAAATTTSVATSGTPSTFGSSVTFTATVTSGATGNVAFYDGATLLGSSPLSGGTATFTTSALSVGAHSITAVYGGDANYTASTSAAITQTVNPLATTTTVATSGSPSIFGSPVTFTATVTVGATGNVTFFDGVSSLGSAPLSGTTAALTTSALSVGAHSITAVYGGDANYAASTSAAITQTVVQASTSISVSGPPRSRINQATSFSFALSVNAPGGGVPSGTVTLSSGASSCTATLPATSCALSFNSLGTRTVSASYAGNASYSASSSSGAGNTQTLVFALSDIAVTKSDAQSTYRTGDLIVYTVTVRNLGPDAAAQIRVRDNVPAGLNNATWSCDASGGASCPQPGGSGNLDVTTAGFANGGLLNFTFFGNVAAGTPQLVNTALVELPADTTIEDPVSGNNSATDTDLLDYLFGNGFETVAVSAGTGSFALPRTDLRISLDEVAMSVYVLDDARGEALRVYARVFDGQLQYALAQRDSSGYLRLSAWASYIGEPSLNWTASQGDDGWLLESAELR